MTQQKQEIEKEWKLIKGETFIRQNMRMHDMAVPWAKTPLSLDVSKVVFDGDAVEAGPEIQVKAGDI